MVATASPDVVWIVTVNDGSDPSINGMQAGTFKGEADALRFALTLANEHLPGSRGELSYQVVPLTPGDVGRRLWNEMARRAL
jgi:hypothetical protein